MTTNILQLKGHFFGEGVNHEGQSFKAHFTAFSKPEINGIAFNFEAIGLNDKIYHSEFSLIGKNMLGQTCLWVMSSNHPGIFERVLKSEVKTTQGTYYVFAFGDKNDRNSFREEILIELQPASVRYVYSWGMPKGDFEERSGCIMQLTPS